VKEAAPVLKFTGLFVPIWVVMLVVTILKIEDVGLVTPMMPFMAA
jgi:hypothetical protein